MTATLEQVEQQAASLRLAYSPRAGSDRLGIAGAQVGAAAGGVSHSAGADMTHIEQSGQSATVGHAALLDDIDRSDRYADLYAMIRSVI